MLYSERLQEMDDDKLRDVERDLEDAWKKHHAKGHLNARDACLFALDELHQEIGRRKSGGPPT